MQSGPLKVPVEVEVRLSGEQMKEVTYEVIRRVTGLSKNHFIKNKKICYNNIILGPHSGQKDILETVVTKEPVTQFHKDIFLLYKKIKEL